MTQLKEVQVKPDTSAGLYHLGMRKKDVLKQCMSQANAIGRNFIIGVLAIHIVSILRLKNGFTNMFHLTCYLDELN